MGRFRKKPVEIEAVQLPVDATPAQAHQVYTWVEEHLGSVDPDDRGTCGVTIDPADGMMMIRTLEGDMKVSPGDWVIRGLNGEFYPCKPDIFAVTYDEVA